MKCRFVRRREREFRDQIDANQSDKKETVRLTGSVTVLCCNSKKNHYVNLKMCVWCEWKHWSHNSKALFGCQIENAATVAAGAALAPSIMV